MLAGLGTDFYHIRQGSSQSKTEDKAQYAAVYIPERSLDKTTRVYKLASLCESEDLGYLPNYSYDNSRSDTTYNGE